MEVDAEIKDLPPKKAAVLLLTQENVKTKDIAKAVDLKESSVSVYQSKLKKFMFTGNIKAQKVAFKTISTLSKGKIPKGSDITEIKDNTAFQASKYISDHNDPVININKNLNVNVDINEIDLSQWE